MSKNIIERHMGGILTAGNVADGARFTIKLPISDQGQ
jgi:signal transduction histidine kinase